MTVPIKRYRIWMVVRDNRDLTVIARIGVDIVHEVHEPEKIVENYGKQYAEGKLTRLSKIVTATGIMNICEDMLVTFEKELITRN